MTHEFEANGQAWITDEATLSLLRQYRAEGNEEMVGAIFQIGKAFGRIIAA